MNDVCRWLDEGEDDGKIVRELKLQNRASEELHKAALVRADNHSNSFSSSPPLKLETRNPKVIWEEAASRAAFFLYVTLRFPIPQICPFP